jgi:hypothetical protein
VEKCQEKIKKDSILKLNLINQGRIINLEINHLKMIAEQIMDSSLNLVAIEKESDYNIFEWKFHIYCVIF